MRPSGHCRPLAISSVLSLYGGNPESSTPGGLQRLSNGQFRRTAGAAGETQSTVTKTIESSRDSLSEVGESRTGDGIASNEQPSTPPWPNIDPFEEAAARTATSERIDKSKLF